MNNTRRFYIGYKDEEGEVYLYAIIEPTMDEFDAIVSPASELITQTKSGQQVPRVYGDFFAHITENQLFFRQNKDLKSGNFDAFDYSQSEEFKNVHIVGAFATCLISWYTAVQDFFKANIKDEVSFDDGFTIMKDLSQCKKFLEWCKKSNAKQKDKGSVKQSNPT